METSFEAFLYLANWGTRWLMFRMQKALPDTDIRDAGSCLQNQPSVQEEFLIDAFDRYQMMK